MTQHTHIETLTRVGANVTIIGTTRGSMLAIMQTMGHTTDSIIINTSEIDDLIEVLHAYKDSIIETTHQEAIDRRTGMCYSIARHEDTNYADASLISKIVRNITI